MTCETFLGECIRLTCVFATTKQSLLDDVDLLPTSSSVTAGSLLVHNHESTRMPKRRPVVKMTSHGIYTQWDSESRDLPRVIEFTKRIPARIDIEFGFVVNIKGAKNRQLNYCIFHPNIPDADGVTRPPFDGTVYVKTNDWNFFLGDTVWEPVADKVGPWRLTLTMDGAIIAEKTFEVYQDESPKGFVVGETDDDEKSDDRFAE